MTKPSTPRSPDRPIGQQAPAWEVPEEPWYQALRSAQGQLALKLAATLDLSDLLSAAQAMRASGFTPELASAALTQAGLRVRATTKFGAQAARMLFTRAGLEQATRQVVSDRRAARLAAAGVEHLVDLGCGIGADTLAFARAGIRVTSVDLDPACVAVTAANAVASGMDHLVEAQVADATQVDLPAGCGVFCDPARRTEGGRRVFDPSRYSPPWDFVTGLPQRVERTVLKLAPGIDHDLLPAGAETEWVSVNGELVEAACWCGPLAQVQHRATVLRADGPTLTSTAQLSGSGKEIGEVGSVGEYLYDPDPAVIRAHLVAEFAQTVSGVLADPMIAYVYADRPDPTPFARCYQVLEVLPVALKRLRAALRARDIGSLTILKRGSALDVERLRNDLRLTGRESTVLVLTRVAGAPSFLRCAPVRAG